jgi:hypothetical protein
MHKSDLLQLFLSLTDQELRDAKQFLQSPYFNQRADVVALFEHCCKTAKKAKPNWDKAAAYRAITPLPYDDVPMRHTMSYLLQRLQQFLSVQEWEKDPIRQSLDLHKSLRNRNLDKATERVAGAILQQLEQEPLRNHQHHYHRYRWQAERYAFIHRHRRTGDMHLQEMTEAFTIYYVSEALRQGCLLRSHQNLSKQDYDFSLFEELLHFIERRKLETVLAVAVYYHSYLSITKPNEVAHFHQLKMLLTAHWAAFSQEEMRDLYLIAINYCIKQQNKGEQSFVREGFELYKTGIENKILLENGILSVFTYKNVHLLADKLGEYDWIVLFLEKYKTLLPAEQRENHYNFNLAQYYFRRRQYQKAMPLLQTIEFSDVLHNLDARKMLLIMYYDLGEYDALDALMERFKTYLQRQKDLGYHRESFLNLLHFVKQLLLFPSMTKKEKQALIHSINACQSLAEKSWLLGQCEKT